MKKIGIKTLISIIIILFPMLAAHGDNSNKTLSGKVLLQVESKGECWYINPADLSRYYLADGKAAFTLMRNLGVGISNNDLNKLKNNQALAKKQSGKIFIQVQDKGQAYYVNSDGNLYYLKNGSDAFNLMRKLGLGITNNDLNKIEIKSLKKEAIKTTSNLLNSVVASSTPESIGKNEKIISNIKQIQTALEMYYNENNNNYPENLSSITKYLSEIPSSPKMNEIVCPKYSGYKYDRTETLKYNIGNYELTYCIDDPAAYSGVILGLNTAGPAAISIIRPFASSSNTGMATNTVKTRVINLTAKPAATTTSATTSNLLILNFKNKVNNQPIPGVHLTLPSSSLGFTADMDGKLKISRSYQQVYTTQGLGFKITTLNLNDYRTKNSVDILLEPEKVIQDGNLLFPKVISSVPTGGATYIAGSVVDKNGQPLTNQTVAFTQSSISGKTDQNGNFNINLIFAETVGERIYFPPNPVYYQMNVYKGYRNTYETIRLTE